MTESEFAAIKERWGSNCHPADSPETIFVARRDIARLALAVEGRDAIIHDLTLDNSHLTRLEVDQFIAKTIAWIIGKGFKGGKVIVDHLRNESTIRGESPPPLPPAQVRMENERLRWALGEVIRLAKASHIREERTDLIVSAAEYGLGGVGDS